MKMAHDLGKATGRRNETISRSIQWACGAGVCLSSRSGASSARRISRDVPPARTTPISPSCMAMKFLVCRLKALVSDAMNVLPGAKPMFIGLPLQATTTESGSLTLNTATPHVPSHFCKDLDTASLSSISGWASNSLPMSWAMTSVSV